MNRWQLLDQVMEKRLRWESSRHHLITLQDPRGTTIQGQEIGSLITDLIKTRGSGLIK